VKRWTLPLVPFLLLLLFSVAAEAQTSTAINPSICIHLYNCVLYDAAGHTVWSDLSWNGTTGAYQGFLEYGKSPNLVEFTDLVQYPVANPVNPNPADSNHILYSCQFKAPNGTLYTEVLKGYSYYYRGGGGRGGGGAGIRYAITSGSITIQPAI
jgi:hypothetical protein